MRTAAEVFWEVLRTAGGFALLLIGAAGGAYLTLLALEGLLCRCLDRILRLCRLHEAFIAFCKREMWPAWRKRGP